MEWSKITRRYKIGQHVIAEIEKIDHAGLFSIVDGVAKGYTKRVEALLTQRTVDLMQKFEIGQKIAARVIGYNVKHQTLELSFKQAQPDPWPDFMKNIRRGDFITGQVVLLTESKALVEIIPGVAGIIHKSETWIQAEQIEQIFMVDDVVRLQIVDIDSNNKLLILSAKGLFANEVDVDDSRATFKMEEKLSEALQLLRWQQSRQTQRKYTLSKVFQSLYKKIYIFDSDEEKTQPLQQMLAAHAVDSCFISADDLMQVPIESAVGLVSCCRVGKNFLPSQVQEKFPSMPLLVYGTMEQFDAHKKELAALPKNISYIRVPHSSKQLIKTLNLLAENETVDDAAFALSQDNSNLEDYFGESAKPADLLSVLEDVQKETAASFAVIFQINLNSMETDVYASVGTSIEVTQFDRGHLQFSPISDVIVDGDFVREEHCGDKFKYMKCLGQFGSLVGIRINFCDEAGYGLFLFGKKPAAFEGLDAKLFAFCEMAVRSQLERKKLLERSSDEQKFVLSGKLTSNFMHEVKNQIQAMDYWLDILKTDSINLNKGALKANDKYFLARFESAIDGALKSQKRNRHIEELFLDLLRKDEKKTIHLDRYLADFIETLKPIAQQKKIRVELEAPHGIEVKINVSSFNQILINLFLNSIDFIPLVRKQTGLIQIKAYKVKKESLPIKIEIKDNGPGINKRNFEKIFEMLYTTKSNGSGLGLAISRRLMDKLGGSITVKESIRLSGVTFLLELPIE